MCQKKKKHQVELLLHSCAWRRHNARLRTKQDRPQTHDGSSCAHRLRPKFSLDGTFVCSLKTLIWIDICKTKAAADDASQVVVTVEHHVEPGADWLQRNWRVVFFVMITRAFRSEVTSSATAFRVEQFAHQMRWLCVRSGRLPSKKRCRSEGWKFLVRAVKNPFVSSTTVF